MGGAEGIRYPGVSYACLWVSMIWCEADGIRPAEFAAVFRCSLGKQNETVLSPNVRSKFAPVSIHGVVFVRRIAAFDDKFHFVIVIRIRDSHIHDVDNQIWVGAGKVSLPDLGWFDLHDVRKDVWSRSCSLLPMQMFLQLEKIITIL